MKKENKDKLDKHDEIISHHEKTINRIKDGSSSFKLEDQEKAKEEADKMINQSLDEIDKIIEDDKAD